MCPTPRCSPLTSSTGRALAPNSSCTSERELAPLPLPLLLRPCLVWPTSSRPYLPVSLCLAPCITPHSTLHGRLPPYTNLNSTALS